jgi:hypothetical protein
MLRPCRVPFPDPRRNRSASLREIVYSRTHTTRFVVESAMRLHFVSCIQYSSSEKCTNFGFLGAMSLAGICRSARLLGGRGGYENTYSGLRCGAGREPAPSFRDNRNLGQWQAQPTHLATRRWPVRRKLQRRRRRPISRRQQHFDREWPPSRTRSGGWASLLMSGQSRTAPCAMRTFRSV